MPCKQLAAIATVGMLGLSQAIGAAPTRLSFGFAISTGAALRASLLPPQEPGWQVRKGRGLTLDLVKPGASAEENQQIEAYLMQPDPPFADGQDYLDTMARNIREDLGRTRLKIVSLTLTRDPRLPRCVRGHQAVEDPPQHENSQTWYSDRYFLRCVFRSRPGIGLDVAYYHRRYGNHPDPSVAGKAAAVLDSVELTDR